MLRYQGRRLLQSTKQSATSTKPWGGFNLFSTMQDNSSTGGNGSSYLDNGGGATTPPPVTTFTEDEEMIRDTVRAWAQEELKPIVREMDNEAKLRPEILNSLFAQGFMGMEIPEEYGGSGLSFTSACLVVEEISRVDPSVSIMVDIHNTLTNNAVRFWGSDILKERWLPRLATDTVSSFCLSEAGSGSDAFAMTTTAERSADGSYFTVNGTKLWISNAKEAGVFLVFANADPAKGYKGITAFMVDAETDGITVGPPEQKLGLKASSTCPVIFDNVRVDSSNVLGQVGLGYKYCINILNEGRIGIAAQQLGIAKGCMDIAIPYLMERKQFGQPIADFQVRYTQTQAFSKTEKLFLFISSKTARHSYCAPTIIHALHNLTFLFLFTTSIILACSRVIVPLYIFLILRYCPLQRYVFVCGS